MNKCILYIGMVFLTIGCSRNSHRLHTGDLLFIAGKTSAMTGAITAATGANEAIDFSHVGIIVQTGGVDSVLEASTQGGVRMVTLQKFMDDAAKIDGKPVVTAMRLNDTTGVAAAVARARTFIGQPYDYSYLPENGKLYCSELVWESYLAEDGGHLFAAHPMNFRAADGSMPPFWTGLFAKLGEPIPQGIPGTNPNDMAQEPELREIYRWF